MAIHVKEALLKAAALRTQVVDVDGVQVTVREVSMVEFAAYGVRQRTDNHAATAALLAACVVGEDGSPLFNAEEAATVANSARIAVPIINAVMELSGYGEKEPAAR